MITGVSPTDSAEIQYHLTGQPQGSGQIQIPLSEAEFESIRKAREHILTLVLIEEKFGMVLESLFDFEQALLDVALRYMVFAQSDYASTMKTLFLTTRLTQNLLSNARLYLDHVPHDLSKLYGSTSEQADAFAAATSKEYDARLGYRVMEELRNFLQHRGLPLRYVSVGWRRETLNDPAKTIANPEMDLKLIGQDRRFKPKVLAQLEALIETPKLKVLVRDYVEGLTNVQIDLRMRLEQDTENAIELMRNTRAHFTQKTGEKPRFLHLSRRRKDAASPDEFYLGMELVDHLQRLQHLYSRAQYITRTIVSSEA